MYVYIQGVTVCLARIAKNKLRIGSGLASWFSVVVVVVIIMTRTCCPVLNSLSGLSPFLGNDDSETLNNVLTVNWYLSVLHELSKSTPVQIRNSFFSVGIYPVFTTVWTQVF